MNKVALFGGIALGVIAGFCWSMYPKGQTAATPAARTSLLATFQSPSSQVGQTSAGAVDIAQIRAVVREELAAAVATLKDQTPSRSGKPAAAPEPPPAPELLAQRREALATIDNMVAGGDWGNEERALFHSKMAVLDPDQAARALHEVVVGLNTGTIHAHTDGPAL